MPTIVCIPMHAMSVHMNAIIPSKPDDAFTWKNINVPSCPYLYAKVQSCRSLYVNKSVIMPTPARTPKHNYDHTCAYTRVMMRIRVCIQSTLAITLARVCWQTRHIHAHPHTQKRNSVRAKARLCSHVGVCTSASHTCTQKRDDMPTCICRHRTAYLRSVLCWDGRLQFQFIICNNPCVGLVCTRVLSNIPSSIRSIQLLIHARKQQCCNSILLSPCNWQARQGQRGKAEEVSCFVVCLAISVLCWCLGFLCMFIVCCPQDMSHVLPVHDFLVNMFFTTKWLCDSACYAHVCALVGAIMPTHVCTWPTPEHRPTHVCTHRCDCTHTCMHK